MATTNFYNPETKQWEHLSGSEMVPIDPTLTQAGQAADAKAVGEALNGKPYRLIQSTTFNEAAKFRLANLSLQAIKVVVRYGDGETAAGSMLVSLSDNQGWIASLFSNQGNFKGRYGLVLLEKRGGQYQGSVKLANEDTLRAIRPDKFAFTTDSVITEVNSNHTFCAGTVIEVYGVDA